MFDSWRSEYSGEMRSVNDCSSALASSSVSAMKGTMPGSTLISSGLRPYLISRALRSV